MREQVEIGRGRSAHRSYTFDDLDIVPSRRTRSSSAVSTAWQLDAYRFDLPLLTHPTDAVVSPASAVRVGDGKVEVQLPLFANTSVPHGGAWIEAGWDETASLAPTGATTTIRRRSCPKRS